MTRPDIILGVDPGQSGGYALLDAKGKLLTAGHFPQHKPVGSSKPCIDAATLAQTWRDSGATCAFVENVAGRPRQAGQFQFGVSTGLIHGILYALHIPFTLVAPASWKAAVGIKRHEGETKRQTKTRARTLVSTLFPEHAERFARVKDDGPAEAVLIATYGVISLTNKKN